jgi:hypothetical protein
MGNSTSTTNSQPTVTDNNNNHMAISSSSASSSSNDNNNESSTPPVVIDRLQEGPCADIYQLLQACRNDKRITRHDRALTLCVSETDLLIKCIHRHPAYFSSSSSSS